MEMSTNSQDLFWSNKILKKPSKMLGRGQSTSQLNCKHHCFTIRHLGVLKINNQWVYSNMASLLSQLYPYVLEIFFASSKIFKIYQIGRLSPFLTPVSLFFSNYGMKDRTKQNVSTNFETGFHFLNLHVPVTHPCKSNSSQLHHASPICKGFGPGRLTRETHE